MLNVFYGDMPGAILDTSEYFDDVYEDAWITKPLTKEMIKAVDKSEVIDERTILSPVFGYMSPRRLSGGVKTLILIDNDPEHVYNASNCGNNCAKWLLKIAENKEVVINLRHLMDFGRDEFEIKVLNLGKIMNNMRDIAFEAGDFV